MKGDGVKIWQVNVWTICLLIYLCFYHMNNFPKSLLSLPHSPVWTIPKLPFASKIKVQALSAWHSGTSRIWPLPHFPPWSFPNSCQNESESVLNGADPFLILCSWSRHSPAAPSPPNQLSLMFVINWNFISSLKLCASFYLLILTPSCFSLLIPEEHERDHSCPLSPPYLTIPLFLLPQINNV